MSILAYDKRGLQDNPIRRGAIAHLAKPFLGTALLAAIKSLEGYAPQIKNNGRFRATRRSAMGPIADVPSVEPKLLRLVRRLPAWRHHVLARLRVRAGIAQPLTTPAAGDFRTRQ